MFTLAGLFDYIAGHDFPDIVATYACDETGIT